MQRTPAAILSPTQDIRAPATKAITSTAKHPTAYPATALVPISHQEERLTNQPALHPLTNPIHRLIRPRIPPATGSIWTMTCSRTCKSSKKKERSRPKNPHRLPKRTTSIRRWVSGTTAGTSGIPSRTKLYDYYGQSSCCTVEISPNLLLFTRPSSLMKVT